MRRRLLEVLGVVAVILAVIILLKVAPVGLAGQSPGPGAKAGTTARAGPAPKTAWGDPDLQGIWTDEFQTPLQRAAKYANKELFTDEERAELDNQRAGTRGPRRFAASPRASEEECARRAGRRRATFAYPCA